MKYNITRNEKQSKPNWKLEILKKTKPNTRNQTKKQQKTTRETIQASKTIIRIFKKIRMTSKIT